MPAIEFWHSFCGNLCTVFPVLSQNLPILDFFFFEVSGSQSVPFGPEVSILPGKLLEMQLLGPQLY